MEGKNRRPLWREICCGGGDLSGALVGGATGSWLSCFYMQVLGFDAMAIGFAMVIYSIWNPVNDPLTAACSRLLSRSTRNTCFLM